jgi:hypothetical protein
VALPRGWYAGTPADGNVIDPLTRVVASSAPIRLSQVPCQIARYSPPAADVSLAVVEWEPSDYARRVRARGVSPRKRSSPVRRASSASTDPAAPCSSPSTVGCSAPTCSSARGHPNG